jgi:hypothetical protein
VKTQEFQFIIKKYLKTSSIFPKTFALIEKLWTKIQIKVLKQMARQKHSKRNKELSTNSP